ncbi:MAG: HD family phosphohydrolase [Leptospiraceae bacterium]|nr:MAG: HD family phosphohydrolase [Leptospiraceae bacterium]
MNKLIEIRQKIKPVKQFIRGKEFEIIPFLFIESQFAHKDFLDLIDKDINVLFLEDFIHNGNNFNDKINEIQNIQKEKLKKKFNQQEINIDIEKVYPIGVIFLSDYFYFNHKKEIINLFKNRATGEFYFILLSNQLPINKEELEIHIEYFYAITPNIWNDSTKYTFSKLIDNCIKQIQLQVENFSLITKVELSHKDLSRIIRIGQILSTEKDFDTIIEMILKEAIEMVSADGGSIYITEYDEKNFQEKPKFLRFKKSALQLDADEFLLPIDSSSIAGYVAMSGEPLLIDDVYSLTGNEPYKFNLEYDLHHNYLTRSMLVIPMKNQQGDVVGVIQLINKRIDPYRQLTYEEMKNGEVLVFTQDCMKKVFALAGQAAVVIENFRLLNNINRLFEGFVRASVLAIEQRDPTTSGHSFRVAEYTVALALAVNRLNRGKYKDLYFNDDQIREIRYASLLHDFGKVGVREKVLVKEKKLYPEQLNDIKWRFRYAIRSLEYEYSQKKIEYLKRNGTKGYEDYEKFLNFELQEKINELQEMEKIIEQSNEPTVIEKDIYQNLEKISHYRLDLNYSQYSETIQFLKENELVSLLVRRGNLDQRERVEIESHVSHTYRFLIQIPWTKDLRNIPDIAHGHHEKLDGSGYPLGLKGDEIMPQTRMMTISDIYDALTAPDRPYKKSLKPEDALDILKYEAKEGRIDSDLLDLFIEAKIYQIISPNAYRTNI